MSDQVQNFPLPLDHDPSRSITGQAISADEAVGLVESLAKAGIDPARVKAAANASGFEVPPDDTRNASERAFDETFPPANPQDFRISYFGRIPDGTDGAGLQELDAQARSFLSAAGFSAEIGASVIELALDAVERVRHLSDAGRKTWDTEQARLLTKVAKSPEAAETMRTVAEKVLEFGPKEFTDRLRASGALSDAAVIVQLALQGERMAHRARFRQSD
jgi:hypothetical protein